MPHPDAAKHAELQNDRKLHLAGAAVKVADYVVGLQNSLTATRPVNGKSKKRKAGGRPKKYSDDEDRELVEDWECSGDVRKVFCRDRGLPVNAVKKAQTRIRARERANLKKQKLARKPKRKN
jgi:hypothetical protein